MSSTARAPGVVRAAGAGDQIEREGGVYRRCLPSLQIGKAFLRHAFEPVADFLDRCLCAVFMGMQTILS